jgi:transposase
MIKFCLTDEQRRLLRAQLNSTEDINLYRRTLALLEVDQGRSPADISRSFGVSCSSVYNWLDAFETTPQPSALTDHRAQGRPSLWTNTLDNLLCETLKQSPNACGYQAVNWTVPLLQMHLIRHGGKRLSDPTIRRKLHEMGYVWEHSRFVLLTIPEVEKNLPDAPTSRTARAAA